jgi:hypothetical protein
LPKKAMEKSAASLPFFAIDARLVFVLQFCFIAADPNDYFADVAGALPLRNEDEELECCMRRVSFG